MSWGAVFGVAEGNEEDNNIVTKGKSHEDFANTTYEGQGRPINNEGNGRYDQPSRPLEKRWQILAEIAVDRE